LLPARARRDEELKPQIQRVWQANLQVYGADKVWRQLNREGIPVARCTVERLMKCLGLEGVRRGKVVRTTVPDHAAPCPLDRVNRQFQADRRNQLWVSDFTYVSTWQGWLYVACVIEVFVRRIEGWRVSSSMYTGTSCSMHWSSPVCPAAWAERRADPPQRQRVALCLHPVYGAPDRGRHRTFGRQPWRQL